MSSTDELMHPAFKFLQWEQYERRRLSQRLHDDLQQLIVVSKMILQRKWNEGDAPKEIQEVVKILNLALDKSRSFAVELSPPLLYKSGLKSASQWLTKWVFDQHKLKTDVRFLGPDRPIPEPIGHFLIWSVKELLLSIPAESVSGVVIEIHFNKDGDFQAVLKTEGGPSTLWRNRGPELTAIQDRLELLGGQFKIDFQSNENSAEIFLFLPSAVFLLPQKNPKVL